MRKSDKITIYVAGYIIFYAVALYLRKYTIFDLYNSMITFTISSLSVLIFITVFIYSVTKGFHEILFAIISKIYNIPFINSFLRKSSAIIIGSTIGAIIILLVLFAMPFLVYLRYHLF